jgi:hypothetical protein
MNTTEVKFSTRKIFHSGKFQIDNFSTSHEIYYLSPTVDIMSEIWERKRAVTWKYGSSGPLFIWNIFMVFGMYSLLCRYNISTRISYIFKGWLHLVCHDLTMVSLLYSSYTVECENCEQWVWKYFQTRVSPKGPSSVVRNSYLVQWHIQTYHWWWPFRAKTHLEIKPVLWIKVVSYMLSI